MGRSEGNPPVFAELMILMKEQRFKAIETQIGVLVGRNAIYLNSVFYDGGNLIIEGSFNGRLASIPTNEDVFYRLIFSGVLALKMTELDSFYYFDPMSKTAGEGSSFDEILNSRWVAELGGKVTRNHKHYSFGTYDDIFDVVCDGYELQTWISKPFPIQKG